MGLNELSAAAGQPLIPGAHDLTRRQALRLGAAAGVALACAPTLLRVHDAFAQEAVADEDPTMPGIEPSADSWRYSDGEVLEFPDTDGAGEAALRALSTEDDDSDKDADADTDVDADAGSDSDVDADAGSDSDVDADVGSDSDADDAGDSDASEDADEGSDAGSDDDTGSDDASSDDDAADDATSEDAADDAADGDAADDDGVDDSTSGDTADGEADDDEDSDDATSDDSTDGETSDDATDDDMTDEESSDDDTADDTAEDDETAGPPDESTDPEEPQEDDTDEEEEVPEGTYSSWDVSCGTSGFSVVYEDGTSALASVSDVVRVGVDVSRWQYDIDWASVAEDGITFAVIRCGYGMDEEEQDDAYFITNVQGARDNGIAIGVYLYSYATNVSRALSEAEHALRLLDEAGLEPDDLDLPVFLDMEDSSTAEVGEAVLGAIAQTFCSNLAAAGFKVGVYANKNWWTNYLTADVFSTEGWYRWVARYPVTTSLVATGVDDTSMWQFTSHGVVSGIDGYVDVNFDFLGEGAYAAIEGAEAVIVYGYFSDVTNPSKYWYEPIYNVAAAGYMTGKSSTYFGASDTLNRANMVTVLWRIACAEEYSSYTSSVQSATTNATDMDDVEDGKYYTAAVNWAYGADIITGKVASDGTFYFDPLGTCTFQNFCTMLARYLAGGDAALNETMTSAEALEALAGFSDAEEVSAYARRAIAYCVDSGAVSGYGDGTIRPTEKVPRGRAATVVYKAMKAGLLG